MTNIFDLSKLDDNINISVASAKSLIEVSPDFIKRELDRYVVGQEDAKRILSFSGSQFNSIEEYNLRALDDFEPRFDKLKQPSVFITGPSGSGKTYMVERLAHILDVPFVSVDATHLSPTGYKGMEVSSILVNTIKQGSNIINRTNVYIPSAIVFIDEMDKLSKSQTDDTFSTSQIQREFLKMIEGAQIDVEKSSQQSYEIDTRNIMWVFGGSFSAFRDAHKTKLKQAGKTLGFVEDPSKRPVEEIKFNHDLLIEAGLLVELVGRIDYVTDLHALSKDDLINIIKNSEGSELKKALFLAELRGEDLEFSDEEINEIAERAIKAGTGARALASEVKTRVLNKLAPLTTNN